MRKSFRRLDPDLAAVLALLFCGLIAYSNSFFGAFHYDDIRTIVENDAIQNLADLRGIYSYCEERFLTYLTLAINFRISKFDTTSYHIFNFFIHYFAAFFLYFLFVETYKTPILKEADLALPKRAAAFLVAGIFLLHPLQTQAVTYVIQRAESMAGMFYLGCLFFYVRARLARSRYAEYGYYLLAILSALCAASSKETAVTLPAMIVCYEILFFQTSIKDLLRNKVILLSIIPACLIVGYKSGNLVQKDFFYDPGIPFTRKEYLLTQFSVLVTYLRLFFWPTGQNLDWDYPLSTSLFSPEVIYSLLILIGLLVIAFLAHRKFRLLALGVVAFFIVLAPTSSIIPIRDPIYEHRMYLAVAFLSMGCVQVLLSGLSDLGEIQSQRSRVAVLALATIAFSVLSALTYSRNEVWVSELSLWRDAVQKSPNKARPHNNYGRALYLLGRRMTEEAKKEFEIANRLSPGWAVPYHNLAIASFEDGDYQTALALDRKAIAIFPKYREALHQLGRTCIELENWHDARKNLERLIRISKRSKYLRAHVDLLEVYLKLELRDRAVQLVESMEKMPGDLSQLDYHLGMAFYKLEDLPKAKHYFKKQLASKAKRIPCFLMLGQIYYLGENYDMAEMTFRQALEEQPWSGQAHFNLALILKKEGSYQESRTHFQKALAVNSFAIAPAIHLIGLYSRPGDSAERIEYIRKLLGLKRYSEEFKFLEANKDRELIEVLSAYTGRFLTEDSSPASQRAHAAIATLTADFHAAVKRYEGYLVTVADQRERGRVEREISRLQGIMNGREPLLTPA
ncbi:MAG: tetratricopeptide repeat protein [Deltaproteobacteria bacterium]|nr:MAG: tetratricopeptide repeat protein [Deltaproteobacteria bacterium]